VKAIAKWIHVSILQERKSEEGGKEEDLCKESYLG